MYILTIFLERHFRKMQSRKVLAFERAEGEGIGTIRGWGRAAGAGDLQAGRGHQ